MSGDDGTCEYVLNPDNPETWGGEEGDECLVKPNITNEEGIWTCPHTAQEEEKLCIFHIPVDRKSDAEVINKFKSLIAGGIETHQFIGAKFGKFHLSGLSPRDLSTDTKINFSHATFGGEVDWSESNICAQELEFRGAVFRKPCKFIDTDFECEVSFTHSNFEHRAVFSGAKFSEPAIFANATFQEKVVLTGVKFNSICGFMNATINGDISFNQAVFERGADFDSIVVDNEGKTNFFGSEFKGEEDVDFSDTEFKSDVTFSNTRFNQGGKTNFIKSHFQGPSEFNSVDFCQNSDVDFTGAIFDERAEFSQSEFREDSKFIGAVFRGLTEFEECSFRNVVGFFDASFLKDVSFLNSEFQKGVFFDKCDFNGVAYFQNLDLRNADFPRADISDADFSNATTCGADFESALLSRATLFGSDLRGAQLDGAVLGDVRIDEDTKFLGHPTDDTDEESTIWDTLSELVVRSGNYCVYDPRYKDEDYNEVDVDSAKSVYRALEELAGRAARPQLQSTCFVNRQGLQQRQYWNSIGNSDNPLEWLINSGKWSRAKLAQKALLYGESPWRVIAWSLGIILSFALLFPLGGWMKEDSEPLSYSQIAVSFFSEPLSWLSGFLNILADSIYYSTLTYTALGFGDFQPRGFGRFLTTVETGLGAVMLALLVFILGRRAAR